MNTAAVGPTWAMANPADMDGRFQRFLYDNRRRASIVRLLDVDWPQAVCIRNAIAAYITDGPRIGRVPMLHEALDHGMMAYEKSLGQAKDRQRLRIFMAAIEEALLLRLPGLRVRARHGEVWKPASAIPLSNWLQDGDCVQAKISVVVPEAEERKQVSLAYRSLLRPLLPRNWE